MSWTSPGGPLEPVTEAADDGTQPLEASAASAAAELPSSSAGKSPKRRWLPQLSRTAELREAEGPSQLKIPALPESPKNAEAYDRLNFSVDMMSARQRRQVLARQPAITFEAPAASFEEPAEPAVEPLRRPSEEEEETRSRELQHFLESALTEEPTESPMAKRRPQRPAASVAWELCSRRCRRAADVLAGCPSRCVEGVGGAVDNAMHDLVGWHRRRQVRRALLQLAVEAGDLPADAVPGCWSRKEEEVLDELRFSPASVAEAFRRLRPRPRKAVLDRLLDGDVAPLRACTVAAVVGLLLLLLSLLLYYAMAVSVFSGKAVKAQGGGLVDAETGAGPVGLGAAVALAPLWDYPALGLEQLARLEDLLLPHNGATHALRVAAISRRPSGEVLLKLSDSSLLRVEPGGQGHWRLPGRPELRLEMGSWREIAATSTEAQELAWVTQGALATEVAVAM